MVHTTVPPANPACMSLLKSSLPSKSANLSLFVDTTPKKQTAKTVLGEPFVLCYKTHSLLELNNTLFLNQRTSGATPKVLSY